MIFGVLERIREQKVDLPVLEKIAAGYPHQLGPSQFHVQDNFGCFFQPTFRVGPYQQFKPVVADASGLTVIFSGNIYNAAELKQGLDVTLRPMVTENPATLIAALYLQSEQKFIGNLNGKFAFAIWDKSKNWLLLVRDRVGIEPLYYYLDEKRLIFSSRIDEILHYPGVKKELNFQALNQFLLYNYNPGLHTFFKGIQKLRPAHLLILRNGESNIRRWWTLSFANVLERNENEIIEKLRELLRNAVKIRIEPDENLGVFLSGGMDSSTITALTSEYLDRPLHTFSYRCKSISFDESHYAQFMARHYLTQHHETEYRVQDVMEMESLVREMDEPFCDVGINMATLILGRAAQKNVNYIFTGDGGDELFAGHPVYEADKMAQVIDRIPGFIKAPIYGLARLLPDSDKKKNFIVKAKRFAISSGFPRELLSHRWRIYYNQNEMQALLTPAMFEKFTQYSPYEDVLQFNREADGPDVLSRSLYSDYHTVVQFYLRRMNLNNQFHLEPRYPLLDHRLIEYCATLPTNIKFKGWSETKYIFKRAMTGILPDEIVFRKDKLGHSIPLKNWMRDNADVKRFVFDFLSETSLKKRSFFNPQFVQKLIKQHVSKARNNSHRLWALAVLEMWLRKHVDA
ncbi:asparagine synthase (glutamine-hydrolyzing) [candidate division KSB1 bacterium]|nr:asparagine synthase (glutamine-hydrolyzing) [candidate division KSB1 bacterium]